MSTSIDLLPEMYVFIDEHIVYTKLNSFMVAV